MGGPSGGVSAGAELLDRRDATALAAALVARAAGDRGIRALLIKGLSLELHGLRAPRDSADVDVLVEPGRVRELVDALVSGGWVKRPVPSVAKRIPHHSTTLLRSEWPIDIDVHRAFPGLLAGPERAFEVLWRTRVSASVAGVAAWVPDRASSMVVWALHSLRSTDHQARHQLELAELVTGVLPNLGDRETAELAERIIEMGADYPLRSVPAFDKLLGERRSLVAEPAIAAWDRKLARAHGRNPWWHIFYEASPRDWPFLLAWAVWPSRRDLQITIPDLDDTWRGRTRARAERFRRFAARLVGRPVDGPG